MKTFILSTLITITSLVGIWLAQPVPAAALIGSNSQQQACQGINLDQGSNACTSNGTSGLNGLLATTINILSIIVGVAAVIMIIIGGFRYITSGGESSSTASAKNTIIYALIGLVIAVIAQLLVQFVLNKVSKA